MSKIKVTRVSATEFETEDGKIFPHPIPFQNGKTPSVKEFQEVHDQWREIFKTQGLLPGQASPSRKGR